MSEERKPPTDMQATALGYMLMLSDEERMEIIMRFCRACGSDDPRCQCWNDE